MLSHFDISYRFCQQKAKQQHAKLSNKNYHFLMNT